MTKTPNLPRFGPQWFGSIMGTSMLATVAANNAKYIAPLKYFSLLLLITAWLAMIILTIGFIINSLKIHNYLKTTILDLSIMPSWGMLSMGYLAAGSAVIAVFEVLFPNHSKLAKSIDWTTWGIGTLIGLICAITFSILLVMRNSKDHPSFAWGLAVVPPMVASTGGSYLATISENLIIKTILIVLVIACFFVSLTLGTVIFISVYLSLYFHKIQLPIPASSTAWIPLGVVGQSTVAALKIADQQTQFVNKDISEQLTNIAHFYCYSILIIGIPLFVIGAYKYYNGFKNKMPFNLTWWAATFPIGTCVLGTKALSDSTDYKWLSVISALLAIVLLINWTIAFVNTIKTVRKQRLHTLI